MALPPDTRAELRERLVESLAQDISPEITSAQLAEVQRRIAQIESGEVELIPGDEALARVRNLLASAQRTIESSPAIYRWEPITKRPQSVKRTAESHNENLSPAKAGFCFLTNFYPALKCWATFKRPL